MVWTLSPVDNGTDQAIIAPQLHLPHSAHCHQLAPHTLSRSTIINKRQTLLEWRPASSSEASRDMLTCLPQWEIVFCFKLKEANVVNLQLGNVGRNGMENNGKPQCNMTELLLACRGGGARRNSKIVRNTFLFGNVVFGATKTWKPWDGEDWGGRTIIGAMFSVYPAPVRYFLPASLPTISNFHKNSQDCRYLPDKKLDWSELTMLVLRPSLKFVRNSGGEC